MGGFFCPKIEAKLLLWGEKSPNLHLTAEINGGKGSFCSCFLAELVGPDQRCSALMLPLMSLIALIDTTARLLVRLCRTRNRRDLTDVLCYWSIFILPSVPHSLPSAGLPFLSLLLFYTWLSTKLLRRSRRDRFVPVARRNPACTKSLW